MKKKMLTVVICLESLIFVLVRNETFLYFHAVDAVLLYLKMKKENQNKHLNEHLVEMYRCTFHL